MDAAAFLAGEGCQRHAAALLVLRIPRRFVAFDPALAGWLPIFTIY
jgi:hypothetical protein